MKTIAMRGFMVEEWRAVPGFEGKYEVSSLGRVKSLDRVVVRVNRWGKEHGHQWKGRLLRPVLHHSGYLVTKLGKDTRLLGIHRIVAWAFIGPQHNGAVVNHKDGNKLNNTPENLEYVTNSENVRHAYRAGLLSNCGEANGKAVLNEEMVRAIRSFPLAATAGEVAEKVGCKKHNVHQVRRGAWSHVK